MNKEIEILLQEIQEWENARDFDAEIRSSKELFEKKDELGLKRYISVLREATNRFIRTKDYPNATKYYEEAISAVRVSRKDPSIMSWAHAVVNTFPTLIFLYCSQRNYDSATEIFNEYLTYLDDIYDGPMSELDDLNTNYVANSITTTLEMLCGYFEPNMEVFLTLIRKCERFINFADDERTTFVYYMLYAAICELCESTDSEDYKRVKAEADNAKNRMKYN